LDKDSWIKGRSAAHVTLQALDELTELLAIAHLALTDPLKAYERSSIWNPHLKNNQTLREGVKQPNIVNWDALVDGVKSTLITLEEKVDTLRESKDLKNYFKEIGNIWKDMSFNTKSAEQLLSNVVSAQKCLVEAIKRFVLIVKRHVGWYHPPNGRIECDLRECCPFCKAVGIKEWAGFEEREKFMNELGEII
jgi:hypothetical protein